MNLLEYTHLNQKISIISQVVIRLGKIYHTMKMDKYFQHTQHIQCLITIIKPLLFNQQLHQLINIQLGLPHILVTIMIIQEYI